MVSTPLFISTICSLNCLLNTSIYHIIDLQWADAVSIGLLHTLLSDKKGASSLFFVGTYRDNEVAESHILHGFHDWLVALNVPYNTVHLDDLSEENVMCLVSDSLGLLPRLCRPLAQVVSRKTGGNPFFVQTFLRSLGEFPVNDDIL